jgi:hypothetical protein
MQPVLQPLPINSTVDEKGQLAFTLSEALSLFLSLKEALISQERSQCLCLCSRIEVTLLEPVLNALTTEPLR